MMILAPNATTVEIKGATYTVETIPAGEFGTSAVRLGKLVSGECYDLVRTNDNRLECDCPDFVARHADKGTCCKHLAFAVANGLLPVAKVEPAKVQAPAPVTDLDRKRAAMWGLTLPKIETAPALVVEANPAPVVIETAPVIEVDPGESWETWTDEMDSRWTITQPVPAGWEAIEADDAVEAEAKPVDLWFAETTALLLTGIALDFIEDGETGEALALYDHSDPEYREAFDAFTAGEVAGWLEWLNLCQSGCPVSFPEPTPPAPRKTRRSFYPTPEEWNEAAALLNDGLVVGTFRRKPSRPSALPNNNLTDADLYPAGCWS